MGFNASPSSAPDRLSDIVRNAERQASNPKFTEQFKEELNQMKLTQAELMELAKCFEESSVDRIKNDAKTVILEQMKQERQSLAQSINPLNWERETQLKVGGAIVGGTILTVIAAKVLKKMGAVGRKIRNGILFAAGTTAAVAGAMLGFKLWQNWGEMKKQMERVNEAADKFMNATKDAKDKAQKELEEARAKLEEIKNERLVLKKKKDEALAAEAKPSANAEEQMPADAEIDEEEINKKEQKLSEKLQDAVPFAEEKEVTRTIAAQGLLTTHSKLVRMAGLESKLERNAVADVLGREDVRKLPILKLAQVQSAQDASKLLALQPHQPTTARQDKAIYFLGMVCNVELQNPAVHELLEKSGTKLDDLTLGDFLDSTSIIPSFLGRFAKEIQGKSIKDIDMTAVLGSIFSAEENIKEFGSNPLITSRVAELHPQLKDKKNFAFFMSYCLTAGLNRSLKDVISPDSKATMTDDERNIYIPALRNINNTLCRPEVRALLVQFTQNDPDHAKLVEEYLEGDLSIHDAVQLYMFLQLTRNKDGQGTYPANAADVSTTSALMLQMKILQILGKADTNSGSELKYKLMLNTAASLVGNTNLNLPPQVRDLILTMGKFATEQTAEVFYEYIKETATQTWIFLKEANTNPNWAVYVPVYGTEAIVSGWGAWMTYEWWTRDMVEIMSNRLGGKSKLANLQRYANKWRPHITETGRRSKDIAKLDTLSSNMVDIETKILSITNKTHSDELLKSFNNFCYRGFDEASFKQFYQEAAALKAKGVDASVIKEVCKKVREWQTAGYGPVLQRFRFGIVRRMGRRFTGQWKQTGKIRKLGGVGRGVYAGAVALEGAMVYNDYQTLEETQKRIEETLKDLEDNLQKAGFKHRYSMKGVVYEHPCGARINLHTLKESISSFENVDLSRLGVSSTSLAATVLAPSLVLGPGGALVVGGIAVAVEAGITSWEQVKQRDFIMNTPTPVLALLGLGSAIGMDEQDMIEEVSNGMISDLFRDANKDKATILKKTYAILLCQHMAKLGKTNPDLVAELTEGKDMTELFDENGDFFNEGFNQVVKPYLALRLFQLSIDHGVQWSEFKYLKIDEGWFDDRNIRPEDMSKALEEAAEIYLNHLREKRYQEALKARDAELTELKSHIDPNDPATQADYDIAEDHWNETIEMLGQSLVRNTPVSRLPASPNGMTSTAAKLKEVTDGLNAKYPNAKRREIPLHEMYLFQTPETPLQTAERYDLFFSETQKLYYKLEDSEVNEWAQARIIEFNKLIERFPEFDRSGKWRTHFSRMPGGWKVIGIFNTDKAAGQYYKESMTLINEIMEDTVDRYTEFHPEALDSKKGQESMYLGNSTEIYLTESDFDEYQKRVEGKVVNSVKELHLVIDGKDEMFTAIEHAANTWQTPYGILRCAVEPVWKNGTKTFLYHWSFEGTKTGKFEVYHINRLGNREPGVTIEVKSTSKKEIPVESLAVIDYDNPPMVFDMTLTMNDGQKVTINYVELRKLENHPLIDKVVLMKNARGDVQRCRVRLNDEGRKQVRSVSFKEPIGEHSETIFRKKNKENEPGLYGTEKSAA